MRAAVASTPGAAVSRTRNGDRESADPRSDEYGRIPEDDTYFGPDDSSYTIPEGDGSFSGEAEVGCRS